MKRKMQLCVRDAVIVALFIACVGCDGQNTEKTDWFNKATSLGNVSKLLSGVSPIDRIITDDYRQRVVAWCRDVLFKDKSEAEAYSILKKSPMHYTAVAFVELFPSSEHHDEVAHIAKEQFDVVEIREARLISYSDLKKLYGFDGQNYIYKWDNSVTALTSDNGSIFVLDVAVSSIESAIWVGTNSINIPTPVCIGNLQVLKGTFKTTSEGIKFDAGSAFVYRRVSNEAK